MLELPISFQHVELLVNRVVHRILSRRMITVSVVYPCMSVLTRMLTWQYSRNVKSLIMIILVVKNAILTLELLPVVTSVVRCVVRSVVCVVVWLMMTSSIVGSVMELFIVTIV